MPIFFFRFLVFILVYFFIFFSILVINANGLADRRIGCFYPRSDCSDFIKRSERPGGHLEPEITVTGVSVSFSTSWIHAPFLWGLHDEAIQPRRPSEILTMTRHSLVTFLPHSLSPIYSSVSILNANTSLINAQLPLHLPRIHVFICR